MIPLSTNKFLPKITKIRKIRIKNLQIQEHITIPSDTIAKKYNISLQLIFINFILKCMNIFLCPNHLYKSLSVHRHLKQHLLKIPRIELLSSLSRLFDSENSSTQSKYSQIIVIRYLARLLCIGSKKKSVYHIYIYTTICIFYHFTSTTLIPTNVRLVLSLAAYV